MPPLSGLTTESRFRVRRHMPRTARRPPRRSHTEDPVSTPNRGSLLCGGNFGFIGMSAIFGLYGLGQLFGLDRGAAGPHTSANGSAGAAAASALQWWPVALMLCAVTAALLWIRRCRQASRAPSGVDGKVLKAALANIRRASAKHSAVRPRADWDAPGALPSRGMSLRKRALAKSARAQQRSAWPSAASPRSHALTMAAARSTSPRQGPVEGASHSHHSRAHGQAAPSTTARVRRRSARPALPPAIAAALKQEIGSRAK